MRIIGVDFKESLVIKTSSYFIIRDLVIIAVSLSIKYSFESFDIVNFT